MVNQTGRAAGHRCRGDGHARPGIRQRGLQPRHPRLSDGRPFQPDRDRQLRSPAQQQPLIQFFQNNPSLELLKDNIPAYLAAQGDNAFAGISQQDQAAVVANARSFQRVLRVAPNTDVAQTLLGLGITSATQIATLGQQQFFLKATAAGLTKPEANQAFQAAAQRYANVVSLYMQFNRDSIGILPKAMGQVSDLERADAGRRFSATSRWPRCSARRIIAPPTIARRF